MSLARRARLLAVSRPHLNLNPSLAARAQRQLSSTPQRLGGDAHEDHYDPPTGWLFGVKPGEKYEKEGWENVMYWGFCGSLAFGVIAYCYKPDTR